MKIETERAGQYATKQKAMQMAMREKNATGREYKPVKTKAYQDGIKQVCWTIILK